MPVAPTVPKTQTPFDHDNYKDCLAAALSTAGAGRGMRAKLARFLGCQPAFVSQIVNRSTHISAEHSYGVCEFLGYSEQETAYFLGLVAYARAGTQSLRQYYQRQLVALRKAREMVQSRLAVTTEVSADDRSTYYSSWLYGVLHVLTSIPRLQTPHAMAQHLKVSIDLVKEHLNFLVGARLVELSRGRYRANARRIHLGTTSPLLARHHTNWRLRAIADLDDRASDSLHFSAAIAVSEADAKRIKELLLRTIAEQELIMTPSPEEASFALCLDFFRI